MSSGTPSRSNIRPTPGLLVAGTSAVLVAILGVLGTQWLASSPSTAASSIDAPRGPLVRSLGVADGAVPDGTTVFDDAVPGVANLDPALLRSLRRAATDAARDGVEFVVESGWR